MALESRIDQAARPDRGTRPVGNFWDHVLSVARGDDREAAEHRRVLRLLHREAPDPGQAADAMGLQGSGMPYAGAAATIGSYLLPPILAALARGHGDEARRLVEDLTPLEGQAVRAALAALREDR